MDRFAPLSLKKDCNFLKNHLLFHNSMSCYLRFFKKVSPIPFPSISSGEELRSDPFRAEVRWCLLTDYTYENLAVSLEQEQNISIFRDLLTMTKFQSLVTYGHLQLSSEI